MKKKKKIIKNTPNNETLPQVTVTVRLPGRFAKVCRDYAESYGISLNALFCVALAEYFHNKGIK